jgi:hypothetical protein
LFQTLASAEESLTDSSNAVGIDFPETLSRSDDPPEVILEIEIPSSQIEDRDVAKMPPLLVAPFSIA